MTRIKQAAPAIVIVALIARGGEGMVMTAEAARTADPGTLMIADFEESDVLDRIGWNAGVCVSLTDQDVATGQRALEVHAKPFSSHGNKWPYVFFNDRRFRTPVDLTRYSRIAATVREVLGRAETAKAEMAPSNRERDRIAQLPQGYQLGYRLQRDGNLTPNPPFFLIEQQWGRDGKDGHRYRAIWRTESQEMPWVAGVATRHPFDMDRRL